MNKEQEKAVKETVRLADTIDILDSNIGLYKEMRGQCIEMSLPTENFDRAVELYEREREKLVEISRKIN